MGHSKGKKNRTGRSGAQTAQTAAVEPKLPLEDAPIGNEINFYKEEYETATNAMRSNWVATLPSRVQVNPDAIVKRVHRGNFHDFVLSENILAKGPLQAAPSHPAMPPTEPNPESSDDGASTHRTKHRPLTEVSLNASVSRVTCIAEAMDGPVYQVFSFGGPDDHGHWDTIVITAHPLMREYFLRRPDLTVPISPWNRKSYFEIERTENGQALVVTYDIEADQRFFWERPLLLTTPDISTRSLQLVDEIILQSSAMDGEALRIRALLLDVMSGTKPPEYQDAPDLVAMLLSCGMDVPFGRTLDEKIRMKGIFNMIARCEQAGEGRGANVMMEWNELTCCIEMWATKDINRGDHLILG